MGISVVIPALNEEAAIPKLLGALIQQARLADEIVVVDAESTDRTPLIVEEWARRGYPVRCIKGRRGGCGIGRNIGIRSATGEWIALLDCGMEPAPSWLASLEETQKQAGAQAVFGRCRYLPETPFQQAVCAVAWGSKPSPVVPCALIHRSVFETIGDFREDLQAVEDQDWMRRFLHHYGTRCVMDNPVTPHMDVPDRVSVVCRKWILYYACAVKAGVLGRAQVLYLGGVSLFVTAMIVSPILAGALLMAYGVVRWIAVPIARCTPVAWLIHPGHFIRVMLLAFLMDTTKILGFVRGWMGGILDQLKRGRLANAMGR